MSYCPLHGSQDLCFIPHRGFLPQHQSPPAFQCVSLKEELTAHCLSLNSSLVFPDLDQENMLGDDD